MDWIDVNTSQPSTNQDKTKDSLLASAMRGAGPSGQVTPDMIRRAEKCPCAICQNDAREMRAFMNHKMGRS